MGVVVDHLGIVGIQHREGTGLDVQVVLLRQGAHEVDELRRPGRQTSHLSCLRGVDVGQAEELDGEVLGKDQEAAAVVRGGDDQAPDLVDELVVAVHGTDEVLQGSDA